MVGADSKLPTQTPEALVSLVRDSSLVLTPLPFLLPRLPPFLYPQGAPTLGKNVPSLRTLAMATAHPHPRAPQQPGLAPRAVRKGGGGGRLPAPRTHLGCPGYHSNRGHSKVRSREVAKGFLTILYPPTH